jgi:uncharacterized protein YbjT (DUF2867 family)
METKQQTALIVGATGLVGQLLVQKILESNEYSLVRVLVRRPIHWKHEKLSVIVQDFDAFTPEHIKADHVYCTLGTTMKKAGSAEAFYKVDYEYPLAIAKIAHQNGTRRFSIVTALGADSQSMFYYNRVKGQIEESLRKIGFETLLIFRPSLLLGDRSEQRLGERVGVWFANVFKKLIPNKYRGVQAAQVAQAMLTITTSSVGGSLVYESDLLQEF